jgi:hypothetical protein
MKSRSRAPAVANPTSFHAYTGYDHSEPRDWVRDRGIIVRIARRGTESNTKHRRVIERATA